MKTAKKFLKEMGVVGLGVLTSMMIMSSAHANMPLFGSYKGKNLGEDKKIDLVVRPLDSEGAEGSYLGILFQNSPLKTAIYLIHPMEDGTYNMYPRQVTNDGEVIGNDCPNPTLILNVEGNRFTVVNSHAVDEANIQRNEGFVNPACLREGGFHGPMTFKISDHSDLQWIDIKEGKFTNDGNAISVPGQLYDHEVGVALALRHTSGEYKLREKLPGVFTLTNVHVTAEGSFLAPFPSKTMVFLRKPSLFGSNFFVMMNTDPEHYDDVLSFLDHGKGNQRDEKFTKRPWGQ